MLAYCVRHWSNLRFDYFFKHEIIISPATGWRSVQGVPRLRSGKRQACNAGRKPDSDAFNVVLQDNT